MTNVARCSSNKAYERKAALLFVFFSFSRAIVFHQSSPLPSRKVDSVFRSHAVQGLLLLDKTGDGPELQLLGRTVSHVDVGCFFSRNLDYGTLEMGRLGKTQQFRLVRVRIRGGTNP